MSLKRLSPQDLPPGVRTSATHIADGGRLYTFSHVTLGELGRLRVVPHGPTQIEAFAEIAPGGQDTKPFPSMEEVREERRLYRRFLNAQHSIQMFGLVVSQGDRKDVSYPC